MVLVAKTPPGSTLYGYGVCLNHVPRSTTLLPHDISKFGIKILTGLGLREILESRRLPHFVSFVAIIGLEFSAVGTVSFNVILKP